MRKTWNGEVNTDCLECLTLSLVDSHCKAWLEGKLESSKLEGQLRVRWNEWDPWQKDNFSFVRSTGDGGLNNIGVEACYDAASSIGGFGWLQISQDHDQYTNFQLEEVWWHSAQLKRIEQLNRVSDCLLVTDSAVHRLIDPVVARELFHEPDIELVYIVVQRRENCSLSQPLGSDTIDCQVRVDFSLKLTQCGDYLS
jgi:hypothetical protein